MIQSPASEHRPAETSLTKLSFFASLIFISTAAVSIHWHSDDKLSSGWWLLVIPPLWVVIVLLALWEYYRNNARNASALSALALIALLPPFRLSVSPRHPNWIWLPRLGWRRHNRGLTRHLERTFAGPMLVIAGLILPILAIEIFWKSATEIPAVQEALNIATGAIWMAFTVEFIIMISVNEAKLKYCVTHWLDLVIILLPLLSYLRAFRLIKLGKIAKTLKAYRLRSLTTKVVRGATTADLIGRVLRRSPEQQIAYLRQQIQLRQEEIEEIEQRIAKLEQEPKKLQSDSD